MSDHPATAPSGLPRWPEDPAQLLDTTSCPSCLSSLAAARCSACGLDLTGPDGVELLASGRRIHDESVRRTDLIRSMYTAQAAAAPASATVASPVQQTPAAA